MLRSAGRRDRAERRGADPAHRRLLVQDGTGAKPLLVARAQSKGHEGAPEGVGSGASTLAVNSEETPATVAGELSACVDIAEGPMAPWKKAIVVCSTTVDARGSEPS